jgi:preprotein translocase subunit SecE
MAVESRTGKMAKAIAPTANESGSKGAVNRWIEKAKAVPASTKSFYTEVRTEMKKVTSPSRKEVQATTAVVIVTVFVFGLYFWIVDTAIGRGVSAILNRFAHR